MFHRQHKLRKANRPEPFADTDDDALSIMAGETSRFDIGESSATKLSFVRSSCQISLLETINFLLEVSGH